MTLLLSVSRDRLSTRGLLEFQDDTFGPKEFRYTTAPLEPSLSDLVDTALLGSQAFHMLATPEEIEKPDS
ncbi:hypothetical protein AA0120_g3982 [Alternaria tenuissima]|nr:hypothetical protein AA0120_g3982 [Alternaria tenuissima]